MATILVMDHSGDTRQQFDPDNSEQLAWANARFTQLTSDGYTAAIRQATGEAKLVRALDPTVEETLFYPRLVGG
ncbi:hypothetical protein [Bradyrhizobium brasilense]|uniref:Uncharacterized protein n=1 Tax=Bradyrhizobium brasilense TaxID=1419277 RepID=A0A1G7A7X0_9BRAD|nr:hypothetical protein [Bradyrhizobium brasilense]MCC8975490.1 hypothetical protein [Bradyrhizobium brasilense]SDE11028.1 hypothetical protein SAMN05216337_102024 [Bradyrhizobium brasilense]